MKKRDYTQLIQESLVELRALEKKQTNSRLLLRVQFLRFLKSQQVTQIQQAAHLLGISSKHGYDLWQRYCEKGLQGFLTLDYKPRQTKLRGKDLQKFLKQAQTGFASQLEARDYLQQEFEVSYSQQGISALFQSFKIKAKVPRPSNVQADKDAQADYKKSLPGVF
jgi:transposase